MKVLMFGWEFPPHISGGLGTACLGLTKALVQENVEVLFVVPQAHGDEEIKLISASDVAFPTSGKSEILPTTSHEPTIVKKGKKKITTISVPSSMKPYESSVLLHQTENIEQWNYQVKPSRYSDEKAPGSHFKLSGGYGPGLWEQVKTYGTIGGQIAGQHNFDVIHAHDWLTFLAGMEAKKISGKPLVVHVHATEYDRAGDNPSPYVLEIEQQGFDEADRVVTVSEWTKESLCDHYKISPDKIVVVHNGVSAKPPSVRNVMPVIGKYVVTFMGRITYQKGPQYFVDAAVKVLKKMPDVHFIMAGGGDLLPQMIEKVARLRLSSNFHFTGFLKGNEVEYVWSVSQVYVMPSVSEPFGITPLEAIQAGVPVIISNQSGVSEVMQHAIKVDFWDTDALANAIASVLKHKSLSKTLSKKASQEIKGLRWDKAAKKINQLYHELTSHA